MWKLLFMFLLMQAFLHFVENTNSEIEEEQVRAKAFMRSLNERTTERDKKLALTTWAHLCNLTDENQQKEPGMIRRIIKEIKEDWVKVNEFKWQNYTDFDLNRQFRKHSILDKVALPDNDIMKFSQIVGNMVNAYSSAKICSYKNNTICNLALEPELTELFINSRNPEELKHIWVEWRKAIRPNVRELYQSYVNLTSQIAILNNLKNYTDFWLEKYEVSDFREQLEHLWLQMKPLYLQMHAYVRHRLRQKYGDVVSERGPIPAHLLGNMWAQSWNNIFNITLPFPEKVSPDITQEMIKQNYTVLKIFKTAEEFFTSINLTAMPEKFWERSILEKPKDREIVCHASAFDFFDGEDVRIKQCTRLNQEDFLTVHHEMGHIQYFLQYKNQPQIYRDGANPGFQEAVGDTIGLSVQTVKHLHRIGLLPTDSNDPEVVLNNLYKVGLSKIVSLPYSYLVDLWRWDVFSGKVKPENYNCHWWKLREDYQGIEPPVNRSEADFDPASKFHVVADISYIRYFVSYVVQFQFHRALCEKAGQYDPNDPSKPLYNCDIYQSTEAGNALKQMLQLGSSRPWPDALETLTGQRNMDASGLLEYFSPLQQFLEDDNKKNGVFVGWESSKMVCSNENVTNTLPI